MNLEQTSLWRTIVGWAGAVFCLLFILSGFDGLVAQFRTPPSELRAVPGDTIPINGPCSSDIRDVSQLTYVSSAEGVRLQIEAMQSGFWLGGAMWRGLLHLSLDLQPGDYGVIVQPSAGTNEKPFSIFSIKVFPSPAALRQASRSMIQRKLGLSPWLVFSACIGLTGLAFVFVYGISHKRDTLMAVQGRAEIYRVAKTEAFYEVSFGLGSSHGVHVGELLTILDDRGEPVGQVTVTQSFHEDASGTVDLNTVVKPGLLVTKSS